MTNEIREVPLDVLADRYASTPMVAIWGARNKTRLMRVLWVATLKAQHDLGVNIPAEAIAAYERHIDNIDLDEILALELKLRHDVLANETAFNRLAGHQQIHRALTSRDQTDNVEQFQILQSLSLVRDHTVAVLVAMSRRAVQYRELEMVGRSHFVAGQTITFGKRFATWAEELLHAFNRLEQLIVAYRSSLRGIKGPMGTQQDMIKLLGSRQKALEFEQRLRAHLGFDAVLHSVGQVYPRSLDFEVVTALAQLASSPVNMATTFRLMAGLGLLYEGFAKDQKGSSAMPHKINARTCERIGGLLTVIGGFVDMTRSLLGGQWNEGDVSCSVVRRVAVPGAFFAYDGLVEATLTVLAEMGVFEEAIDAELQTNLPLLSTTKLLKAAMDTGLGRLDAHTVIRDNAIAAIKSGSPATFIDRLKGDSRFPVDESRIAAEIESPDHGAAALQVEEVVTLVDEVLRRYPEAVKYQPEPIR